MNVVRGSNEINAQSLGFMFAGGKPWIEIMPSKVITVIILYYSLEEACSMSFVPTKGVYSDITGHLQMNHMTSNIFSIQIIKCVIIDADEHGVAGQYEVIFNCFAYEMTQSSR